MSRLGPIKRDAFIKKLKALGFEGPFPGKRHDFMVIGAYSQTSRATRNIRETCTAGS